LRSLTAAFGAVGIDHRRNDGEGLLRRSVAIGVEHVERDHHRLGREIRHRDVGVLPAGGDGLSAARLTLTALVDHLRCWREIDGRRAARTRPTHGDRGGVDLGGERWIDVVTPHWGPLRPRTDPSRSAPLVDASQHRVRSTTRSLDEREPRSGTPFRIRSRLANLARFRGRRSQSSLVVFGTRLTSIPTSGRNES
jgi:hypothetical protein